MAKSDIIQEKIKKLQADLKKQKKLEKEQLEAQKNQVFSLLGDLFGEVLGGPINQVNWEMVFAALFEASSKNPEAFLYEHQLDPKRLLKDLKELKNNVRWDQVRSDSREIVGG